jgi:hypothetical protein
MNLSAAPLPILLRAAAPQIDHSGQADYSGDLDYGSGTGRAGGQLDPADGSGSEMAAGAVAEGHHPVSIYVFERG